MKKQAAGQRNMRQGRGLGRAGGGSAGGTAQAKKGQLPNLRDIPPSEQGKSKLLDKIESLQPPCLRKNYSYAVPITNFTR